MAQNKKSFVLYIDLIGRIEHLTNEEKGILFQHLLEYVNDLDPILEDRVLVGVWKPIEQQLKRDLKKFEEVKIKRSEAGKRSAQLRELKRSQQNSTNSTSVESVQQTSTNSTVSVNDNVNDSVNVSTKVDVSKEYTQQHFLKRWKDARLHFDKQPTNISKLLPHELRNFDNIKRLYTPKQIEQAVQGLFQQQTYKSIRLRPTHFLELEHFEKYLTCFKTKEKLFENKSKKPKERI